jgi:hypothetical protein
MDGSNDTLLSEVETGRYRVNDVQGMSSGLEAQCIDELSIVQRLSVMQIVCNANVKSYNHSLGNVPHLSVL